MALPRKLLQWLILAFALGLSAVLLVGIWKGKTLQEQQVTTRVEKPEAEMRLTDMEYTEMQDGRRSWTLKAAEAKYFQEDQKTALTMVRLVFFLEDGGEIRLESRQGILYAGTKDIELWDTVRAELPRGYALATERASYRHQQKLISSDTPILLSGPDVKLKGDQWKYLIPERRVLLEGGINATLALFPAKSKPGR